MTLHHGHSPSFTGFINYFLLYDSISHGITFQGACFHLNTNKTDRTVRCSRNLTFSIRSNTEPIPSLQFYLFAINSDKALPRKDAVNFFILFM